MSGRQSTPSFSLPPGWQRLSPFPFAGVNQQDSRQAIGDQEFYWCENLLRLGNGWLRALYDVGTPLYTIPFGGQLIVYFFYFNIGPVNYAAVFLADGTAIQVRQTDGAQTVISATAGTFYNGAGLPGCCGSGGQYLLIVNNDHPNQYFIWDGAILYGAGSLAPTVTVTASGLGYTSPPTVTAYGGAGTGATFAATITNGGVTSVQILTPGTGYAPGDQVQLAFSGGGADSSAILMAVLGADVIDHITKVSSGTGYTGTPSVVISGGGGAGATAAATLTPTTVASVAVGAGGSGYTSVPSVVISGGGGSGATATATTAAGAVTGLTLTASGTGYTGTPTIIISGGGGSGAAGSVALAPTTVAGYTVTSSGTGYTSTPTVSVSGGGGSGASGVAVLLPSGIASVTVVNGGSGYFSTPTLSFVGGGGSGATAVAVVTAGVITGVTMTNAGSGYTADPAVEVQSGINNSAAATVTLMPFGISGSYIETFQSRVWIPHPNQNGAKPTGGVFNVTAPGSLTDFATSDGGLNFTSTDRFLRYQYTFLRQANGYLYAGGDSSLNVISNVQTSGNPSTTTFNYQNTDPQVGTSWQETVADFGRTILFANQLGVWGVYGGTVVKVSAKLDRLFEKIIVPGNAAGTPCLTPSASVATIFNTKVYILLATFTDPFTGLPRNLQLLWNEKDWDIASSNTALTLIGGLEINSGLTSYGTDGTSLYPMFASPSATLTKFFVTKQWGADRPDLFKTSSRYYVFGEDQSVAQTGIALYLNVDYAAYITTTEAEEEGVALPASGSVMVPNNINAVSQTTQPIILGGSNGGSAMVAGDSGDVVAPLLGLKLMSQSPDFSLYNVVLGAFPSGSIF